MLQRNVALLSALWSAPLIDQPCTRTFSRRGIKSVSRFPHSMARVRRIPRCIPSRAAVSLTNPIILRRCTRREQTYAQKPPLPSWQMPQMQITRRFVDGAFERPDEMCSILYTDIARHVSIASVGVASSPRSCCARYSASAGIVCPRRNGQSAVGSSFTTRKLA